MKKIFAIFLVAVMLMAMFAACGEKAEPGVTPSTPVSSKPSDPGVSEEPEEIVEIEFWMWLDSGNSDEDTREKIQNALNEITEKEIGVNVNITWPAAGDYAAQLALAIANKDTIDVALTSYPNNLHRNYANGACMDITDLVYEYGPDIVEALGDVLDAVKIDGRIYNVSCYRNYNSNMYLTFRTDLLEEAGVTELFQKATTWSEAEEILAALREELDMYGLGNQNNQGVGGLISAANFGMPGDNFSDSYLYDTLGDSMFFIKCDSDGNVSLGTEDPGVVEGYKRVADWYDKQYIYPDTAFSQESEYTYVNAGTFAGIFCPTQYGAEVSISARVGSPMSVTPLATGLMELIHPRSLGAFVPVSAAEPVAAVKFLNLLFKNADVMNLLTYGIEGENYQVDAEGEAAFLPGESVATCGYRQNEWWGGNNFILLPLDGNGSDFRARALENLRSSTLSPFYSVNVDLSEHQTLTATISAVKVEYHSMMVSGFYSDEYYNEYLTKLRAAGIDEYVALFQAAVDEFQG